MDHRADIYSLGATLYELLTLRPLFPELDRARLVQQVAFVDPDLPRKVNRQIPVDLATIIEKCIQKDCADRYASAGELAADLKRFVDDHPIQARPPTILKRSLKWANRNSSFVLLSAIASLLVACAAVISTGISLKSRNDVQRGPERRAIGALESRSKRRHRPEIAK